MWSTAHTSCAMARRALCPPPGAMARACGLSASIPPRTGGLREAANSNWSTSRLPVAADSALPGVGTTDVEHLIEPLPLKKLIAQVDIVCSNSMIEAMNKILKYQYLFQRPIPDAAHLEKSVEEAVEDFNNRPNGKHFGLTPNEAYAGKVFDKAAYHERIVEAGIVRRAVNREACPPCIGPERVEGAVKTDNEASE